MKHLDVVLAAVALSCFSLPPASALADDALDDLDVTMEVLDDADRIGDSIPEVRGTGEAAYLEHDAYEDPRDVGESDDELVDDGEFSGQDEYSEEDDGFEHSDGFGDEDIGDDDDFGEEEGEDIDDDDFDDVTA